MRQYLLAARLTPIKLCSLKYRFEDWIFLPDSLSLLSLCGRAKSDLWRIALCRSPLLASQQITKKALASFLYILATLQGTMGGYR